MRKFLQNKYLYNLFSKVFEKWEHEFLT